ncbi:YceI family protein [Pedobacter nutrimenti]|uniref:YceI-like domain-containing protein n=1 Tax=Pedobacter nutrimenti TaxID=1241337 RepID=A0A318UFM9_9SPHI|nr:YceI family protein [Pedobacter nutrimenti]PYF75186.1 YceI-like domain-containing protein [Pedobacter nutrimenti]
MKTLLFLLLCTYSLSALGQDIYIGKNTSLSFFSSTALEDIEAGSNAATAVLDVKTGNFLFKVSNTSFQFKKKLMQEHFNENYMESDKYPWSTFKGKIREIIDPAKNGNYVLTADGNLDIHGVSKAYQVKINISIDKGLISAKTVFRVKLSDHQIKIPSIVFKNIAESVEVRAAAVFQAKKT